VHAGRKDRDSARTRHRFGDRRMAAGAVISPRLDYRRYTSPIVIIGGSLVIGLVAGAALGRVVGNRTGAVVGALVGAVACLVYAYLLNVGLLMPSVTISSTLTVVAALLCGLQGGLFYAFSTAVMSALARQPRPSGMAVMQTINVVVFNPWFGGAFSLAPVACALAMITALARWPAPEAPWIVAGGAIFLIGTLVVTALCNVPRNDALDAMPATAQGAAELWSRYLREWTFWNHVRTGSALVAAVLLMIALINA
jgi:uncharacterized membrane protein